jgi:hypothetical protein
MKRIKAPPGSVPTVSGVSGAPSPGAVKRDIRVLLKRYLQNEALAELEWEGLMEMLYRVGIDPAAKCPLDIVTRHTAPGQPEIFDMSLKPVAAYTLVREGSPASLRRMKKTLEEELIPIVKGWAVWHRLRNEPSGR